MHLHHHHLLCKVFFSGLVTVENILMARALELIQCHANREDLGMRVISPLVKSQH